MFSCKIKFTLLIQLISFCVYAQNAIPVQITAFSNAVPFTTNLNDWTGGYQAPQALYDRNIFMDNPNFWYSGSASEGSTWNNSNPGESIGVLVVDLLQVRSVNQFKVFQMFADGKTTHIQVFKNTDYTGIVQPSAKSSGWQPVINKTSVGAGTDSLYFIANPTTINATTFSTRYLMIHVYNDGSLGSPNYIELKGIKAFFTNGSSYSVNFLRGAPSGNTLLTTADVKSITMNSALGGGNIYYQGPNTVTSRGICWSTSSGPTIANNYTLDGVGGIGSFTTININSLQPNTKYYVRAFATSSIGVTTYGYEVNFSTPKVVPVEIKGYNANPYNTNLNQWTGGYQAPQAIFDEAFYKDSTERWLNAVGSSGSTWYNPVPGVGYGVLILDMLQVRSINLFKVFQMFADGKTTQLQLFANNNYLGNDRPGDLSAGWYPVSNIENIGAGITGYDQSTGQSYVTMPTTINTALFSSRYLKLHVYNDGSLGSLNFIELKGIKAFCFNGSNYSENYLAGGPISDPVITTGYANQITLNRAVCSGNIINGGLSAISSRGICWSTQPMPTVNNNTINSGSGSGNFSGTISGLQPDTKYYVRAFAINNEGVHYGYETSFTTARAIPIEISGSNVNPYNTNLNQWSGGYQAPQALYDQGAFNDSINKWADFTGSAGSTWSNTSPGTGYGILIVDLLKVRTINEFKIFQMFADGKTTQIQIYRNSNFLGNTKPNSNSTGWVAVTGIETVGVGTTAYDPSAGVTYIANPKTIATSDFSSRYIKIHAYNDGSLGFINYIELKGVKAFYQNGGVYSENFMRGGPIDDVMVTTNPATSINNNSAIVQGEVLSEGFSSVTVRGICWNTSSSPTTANASSTNGAGLGSFSQTINGLIPGTRYYARAYAINSQGTFYGPEIQFFTCSTNPPPTWYLDSDNDNYYIGTGVLQCSSPGLNYKSTGLLGVDCDDSNPLLFTTCGTAFWTGAVNNSWINTGNWSGGIVPNATDNATIPDVSSGSGNFPLINTAVTIANITVETNATVTLLANQSLTLSGVLTNNGTITVSSGGSLVQEDGSTLAGSGIYIVERAITAGQRFIGSPINGHSVSGFGITPSGINGEQIIPNSINPCNPDSIDSVSPYGNILEMREDALPINNCAQSLWHVKSTGSLTNARGYAVNAASATTLEFRGTVNNGTVTYGGLTNQGVTIDQWNGLQDRGWHLVSNPYPSPIELSDGDLGAGFDNSVYLFDGSSFTEINLSLSNADIAVGQGFQVRKTNAGGSIDFQLDNSFRKAGNPTFYRQNNPLQEYLSVTLQNSQYSSTASVYFRDGATPHFDPKYDTYRLFGLPSIPLIYSEIDQSKKMAYNAFPLLGLGERQTVPVGVYDGAIAGEFTLTFEGINTLNATVMLEDLKLNTMQQVTEGSTYTFTTQAGDSRDRFLLHFEANLATGIANIIGQGVKLYPNPTNGETTLILSENHGYSKAVVIDVSGRTVQTYELSNSKTAETMNTATLNNGIYFIQLTGSNNNQTLKLIKQ
jgi:hypothetical protein